MAKGKSTWKYNKLLTGRRNYYSGGGMMAGLFQDIAGSAATMIDQTAQGLSNIAMMNHNKFMKQQQEQMDNYARTQQGRQMTENANLALAQAKEDRLQEADNLKQQAQEMRASQFFHPKMFWDGGGLGGGLGSGFDATSMIPITQQNWSNPLYANLKLGQMQNTHITPPKMDFSFGRQQTGGLGSGLLKTPTIGGGITGGGATGGAAGGAVTTPPGGGGKGASPGMSAGVGSMLLGAGLALDNAAGQLIGGDYHTGAGDVIGQIPGLGIVGGLVNRAFGIKKNEAELSRVKSDLTANANAANQAAAATSFDDNSLNGPMATSFNVNAYKGGWFKKGKARRKNAGLRQELLTSADFASRAAQGAIGNIADTQLNNQLATFAAFGGELNTQGGDFTNGMVQINAGGSHESNPFQGVPMGVDQQGVPNLVEEGEVIFNDYVFSRRLAVPKAIRDKYKLRSTKKVTFADAIKKLAKESEERPNDPISTRGLQAIMADLSNAQEGVREKEEGNKFSYGGLKGNIYSGKGKGNQVLNYDNKTTGLYFGLDPEQFNPYNSDGTIDWKIMYGADSPYTKRRQYVLDHWDDPGVQEWLGRYVEGINEYNKGRDGYQPMTKNDITKDIFSNRTWDKSWGGMHAGVDYAGDPEEKLVIEHMLRGADGSLTAMPESDIYYPDTDFETGKSWNDRFKDKYTRVNNGNYVENVDPETHTRTRRYFYDPVESKSTGNRYYRKNADGKYELVEGDNPYLTIQNEGGYSQVKSNPNDQNGTDFYYDPDKNDPEFKKLPTWFRYAPAVGLGISAITDAAGLTNKPDYSNADAVMEAAQSAGTYNPVSFKPIGNYLTYRPFDRDYYINKMNAEAGAARRNIMNTSGGNRAQAMAGILAADNNYLYQLGSLARQAEEYNFAQRAQVEEFNRGTNTTNSQGFLQADLANQKAAAEAREMSLKGTMAAAEMRERARLASEQAKSANISGFINAIGDIGRENMAWNWRNFGIDTGSFGNIGDDELALLTHYVRARQGKGTGTKAKGGKIKKKKGLTY